MATRNAFLAQVWKDVINAPMRGTWIENVVCASRQRPNEPFADLGPVLERLLKLGATPRDLSLIARFAKYEAVFSVLYMLGDPGVDADDNQMLHEELLTADPSGLDGRPGSV